MNSAGDHSHGSSARVICGSATSVWTGYIADAGTQQRAWSVNSAGSHTHHINNTGSGDGHSHSFTPPHVRMLCWRRIS